MPNVLLEAQYLGVPIISSNCPTGPKEILINGKAGTFYKTGNYYDLSNKIKFFIKNKSFFADQVNFAKKNLNRFENNIFLQKYNKILIKNFNED